MTFEAMQLELEDQDLDSLETEIYPHWRKVAGLQRRNRSPIPSPSIAEAWIRDRIQAICHTEGIHKSGSIAWESPGPNTQVGSPRSEDYLDKMNENDELIEPVVPKEEGSKAAWTEAEKDLFTGSRDWCDGRTCRCSEVFRNQGSAW